MSRSTLNSNDREDAEASRSRAEKNPLKRFLARFAEDPYRPEQHYMRGPGPKAKAKALRNGGAHRDTPPKQIGPGK